MLQLEAAQRTDLWDKLAQVIEEYARTVKGERVAPRLDPAALRMRLAGGGAAFVPELRPLLAGIAEADSITFDAHKWLSVAMGAGLYFTRHPDILDRPFARADALATSAP